MGLTRWGMAKRMKGDEVSLSGGLKTTGYYAKASRPTDAVRTGSPSSHSLTGWDDVMEMDGKSGFKS